MPSVAECPSCAEKVRVPDGLVGQRARCPRCSHIFLVADPEGTAPPAPPERREVSAFTPEPAPPRPWREAPEEWEDEDAPRRQGTASGLALTSLILGISSLPLAFCCGLFSVPVAVLAIVFGVVGGRAPEGRAMGVVGWVLGSIALVLMIAMLALGVAINLATIR